MSLCRSLRTDYKIANHVKVNFYFRSESEEIASALVAQEEDFCTLAKGHFLRRLGAGEEAPRGTCIKVINEQLSLLVDLTGVIDVDQELLRLKKEQERYDYPVLLHCLRTSERHAWCVDCSP